MGDTRRKATRLSHPKCAPRRRGSPANAALPPAWQSSAPPPRLSAVASPAFAAAHRLLLPCLRSPETLPAPLAPPQCPHLTARLLARLRPLPSRLVGTPPTPLRLGGAVAISDDGAHASLKFSAASPCGCCDDSSSTTTNTTPATPSCYCVLTPSSRLCCYPACRRLTSWGSLLGAGSLWMSSPSSRTTPVADQGSTLIDL